MFFDFRCELITLKDLEVSAGHGSRGGDLRSLAGERGDEQAAAFRSL